MLDGEISNTLEELDVIVTTFELRYRFFRKSHAFIIK